MYLHHQTIKFPEQGYVSLRFVTPIQHFDFSAAVYAAVREHWTNNNAIFEGIYDPDILMAVQDVPDNICAKHGFQIIKDRYYYTLEAEREPRYNKLHT